MDAAHDRSTELGVTRTELRGRDTEITAVDERLSDLSRGKGGVLLVTGAPGIGKSSLLAEIRDRAGRAGSRVLSAEAFDSRQTMPFGPLLSALRDPGTAGAAGDHADPGLWIIHNLQAELERLTGITPTLVVLDDLQWADAETLAAILTLSAQMRHTGLLWVLSARQGRGGSAAADAFARLEHEGAATLRLGPLAPAATRMIIEDFVGASPEPALRKLTDLTRGHPAWLMEMLLGLREENRLLVREGRATVTGAELPNRLIRSMTHRLNGLSPETHRTIQATAILPQTFTPAQLARTLRIQLADLVEPIEDALAADLLAADDDGLRLRHELLRDVILAGMPTTLRKALERAAAEVPVPADAEVASFPAGSAAAGAHPEQAAATDLSAAAGTTGVTGQTWLQRRAGLAYSLMMGGEFAEAQRLATEVEAATSPPDPTHALAQMVLADTRCARGDGAGALAMVRDLQLVSPGPPGSDGGLRLLHIATVLHCLGYVDEGTAVFNACQHQAERTDDGLLLGGWIQMSVLLNITAGHLTDARAESATMEPPVNDHRPGTFGTVSQMIATAFLARHTGDAVLTTSALAAAHRMRNSDHLAGRRWAARVLAGAAAARSDPQQAARILADDPLLPSSPSLPVDVAFLVEAARIGIAAGDQSLMARAAAAATTLDCDPNIAPAFAAAATHVRGLLARDAEGLLAAAAAHADVRRPLLSAAANEAAGRLLLRRGLTADAVRLLNGAAEAYAAAGAGADGGRVGVLLHGHTVAPEPSDAKRSHQGWSSLTEAELKVIRLIAAGSTNRLAAKQLYLSPHTVNAHVRNAFAKLGINSRVQLANMLRDFDE